MAADPMDERYEDEDLVGIDWDCTPCDLPACPVCAGATILLGTLGRREHYRCRSCGIDHSALTREDLVCF